MHKKISEMQVSETPNGDDFMFIYDTTDQSRKMNLKDYLQGIIEKEVGYYKNVLRWRQIETRFWYKLATVRR